MIIVIIILLRVMALVRGIVRMSEMWRRGRRRVPVLLLSLSVLVNRPTMGIRVVVTEWWGRRRRIGGIVGGSFRGRRWLLIDYYYRVLPSHLGTLLIDFCLYLCPYGRSVFSKGLGGFITRLFVSNVVPIATIVLHAALSGQKPSRGIHGSDFVDDRRCDQSLLALEPSRQVNTFPFFDKAAELFVSSVRVDVSTSAAQHVVGVRCIHAVSAGGGGCDVAIFAVVLIRGRHLMSYRC
jgi:hypothetical protein